MDPNNSRFACTPGELKKAADMIFVINKTNAFLGKEQKATTLATIVKTWNPRGRSQ